MKTRALSAAVLVMLLVASACGSRLTKDERAQVLGSITSGSTNETGNGGVDTGTGGPVATTGPTTSSGPTTPGEGPSDEGGNNNPNQPGVAASCAKATKATDKGVTPDKITIATLADISGVQPGLFQSAHQAVRAAATYINSTGGICGRLIDPMLLDSKTDSGGNRAAMQDACAKAFAVVGSMSAFDDGSAAPGQACGIPDMSAITTNRAKLDSTNTFPMDAAAGPTLPTTPAKYIADKHPDVIKKAGILWLNQAVTHNNAVAREAAWKKVGFQWIYQTEVQVLEANYTRFIQDMRSKGVQFVTMVSDYQSIVRLQKSMRQQNWVPKVRQWDSVAYDQNFLSEKDAVDGSEVFINTAMVEEANPEMRLYQEWLQRVSPGATPTYFGIYAWSAYRLFQKLATQIGPDLTRAKLFAALKATHEWGDNGLHAPHDIGTKTSSVCSIEMSVTNGQFKRLYPASGFDCSGTLAHVG